jgi:Tfp pilus assembly pilus retraction ATPase PilT
MADLRWDRLLETCIRKHATDLLLTSGSPPMVRLRESWRALQTHALDAEAIRALASERLGTTPDGEVDGYAYRDFQYGDPGTRFRAMAFAYPNTTSLLVAMYPNDPDGQGSPVEVG